MSGRWRPKGQYEQRAADPLLVATSADLPAVLRDVLDKTPIGHLTAPEVTKQGVEMVAPFGNSLHVSSRDAGALEAAIAPFRDRPGLVWQRASPSLEDVFIDLMGRARDNFQ